MVPVEENKGSCEKKLDPSDKKPYTFKEIGQRYKGQRTKRQIWAYWKEEMVPVEEYKFGDITKGLLKKTIKLAGKGVKAIASAQGEEAEEKAKAEAEAEERGYILGDVTKGLLQGSINLMDTAVQAIDS